MSSYTIDHKYRSRYASTETGGELKCCNFLGVFNKTIIPLAFVEYQIVIANSALRASLAIYLTIRPVARKGYGSIAHEAKPNGLLTRVP